MRKISDSLLQKKISWNPHAGQREVLLSEARDKIICAGTRWGKSMLCGYVGFKHLMADNQQIWIVSLTYDMAKKIFNYVVDFAGKYDRQLLKGVSYRPTPRFEIREWNSWLECKSIETPTSLMGEELDLAVLDEASRFKSDIWERFIAARLTSRRGRSMAISTPFGKNWFFKRYIDSRNDPTSAAFHFESRDNPSFPPDEWERAKEKLPEDIFNQEYRAIFLDNAASVFRNIEGCVKGELEGCKSGHYYTMGVDLGKYRDFTVLTVIDRTCHKVVHHERFKQLDWVFQKEKIKACSNLYGRPEVWIDSTGLGDPITDDLRMAGLNINDFKYTNKAKEQLIQKLSIFIQQGRISYPKIDVLIDELEVFGMEISEGGRVKYSAPQGLHDDCVNSLALAVWPLSERPATEADSEPIVPVHPKY